MPIQTKQQPPYYENQQQTITLIALLTQTAANPPTLTILTNTLKGTITTARNAAGDYTIDSTENDFPENKTTVIIAQNTDITNASFTAKRNGDQEISIKSWEYQGDGSYILTDGYLEETTIQITAKS